MKTNTNTSTLTTSSTGFATHFNLIKRLPLAIILLALLAPMITGLFIDHKEVQIPQAGSHLDWSADVQKIRAELAQLNDEAANAEKKLWDSVGGRMDAVQARNRSDASKGVEAAVNSLAQADQIGWLIADFAQDKVFGGDRAARRVEDCSGTFIHALKNSEVRTRSLMDSLQQELSSVNNSYAIKVGQVIEMHGSQMPRANFEQLVALQRVVPMMVSAQVGGAAVAVTFEALMIASTKESVRKVAEYLAAKLAPQIGKAASGVGAAAVDGPLPFGDIITVGLAIWTVWDVVSLPDAIRSDMRHQFKQASKSHLDALDAQSAECIKNLSQQSRAARANLNRQVLAGLPSR
jgi:hypothetical protein